MSADPSAVHVAAATTPARGPLGEFHWRLLVLGFVICAFCGVATSYIVLKLGMSTDLSYGAMFLAAMLLGRRVKGSALAIELNIIQTMANAVTGVGFMCVILAAFHFIQVEFKHDIGFHPTWWQVGIWVLVSANLGVFMGAIPRRMLLDDEHLPWPTGVAVQSVVQTLTDERATEATVHRRSVFVMSTAFAGFVTLLKDGFGVIVPMVGNASLKVALGLEMAAFGLGMLVPLAVGLSYLIGVWGIINFGDYVAKLAALRGTSPENWGMCNDLLAGFSKLDGDAKATAVQTLTDQCGNAMDWVSKPHFGLAVQWFMWPATAMMVTAALTSVLIPLGRDLARRGTRRLQPIVSRPEEFVSWQWIVGGIAVCVVLLVWLQARWFDMDWKQVLVAVGIQPLLIIAGIRVLALTGQGPVSLIANATQFVFGLIWPKHVAGNLNAAHIAADPQASAESTMVSFWVARRIGGRFSTLMIAQLLVIPVGAFLLAPSVNMLISHYGFGGDNGLAAPTGLKIASLAMVMEQGIAALPRGALTASIIAAALGIVLELLTMVRVPVPASEPNEQHANAPARTRQRFWWVPIPSVVGFAFILPPGLTIPMAFGSVIAAVWRRFSPSPNGSFTAYVAPMAGGFIAGEAIIAAVLLPILGTIMELLKEFVLK